MVRSGGQCRRKRTMSERPEKLQREWLQKRQRSMINKAAKEGLSNLVHFALQLDDVKETDPSRLVESEGEENVPLITACLAGHLDVVKDLLEKCHAPLHCTGKVTTEGQVVLGATPLWCAAVSGNLDLVKYLLRKGAKVDEPTSTKSTPLRSACYDGNLAMVQLFVQKGADVNSINQYGHSVLMVAVRSGNRDVVQCLLDNGADVNETVPRRDDIDFSGDTALHQCASDGNVEMARLLIERGATITHNENGETPLMRAAYKGHDALVEFLVDTPDCSRDDKADALELLGTFYLCEADKVDANNCLSLWKRAMESREQLGKCKAKKREAEKKVVAYDNAVEVQTLAEVERLMSNPDQHTIRMQAVLVRERILGPAHEKTIKALRWFAAHYADEKKFSRSLDLLLRALKIWSGPSPPFDDLKLRLNYLSIAVIVETFKQNQEPALSIVLQLLDMCIDEIRQVSKDPKLRLQKSKEEYAEGCQAQLKIALQFVFIGIKTQNQAVPQERQQLTKAVKNLVQTNMLGKSGSTLLHLACTEDTTKLGDAYDGFTFPAAEVVKVLLALGSDVNARNEDGQTALQIALAEGDGKNTEVTRLLVAAGAH